MGASPDLPLACQRQARGGPGAVCQGRAQPGESRTLDTRSRANTLVHGRMRRVIASGHADPSGARRGAQAAHEHGLEHLRPVVAKGPQRGQATLARCGATEHLLRWWIGATKPGKTRGLVSVSSRSTGRPDSGASLAVRAPVSAVVRRSSATSPIIPAWSSVGTRRRRRET